jgi:hypothetical protein
MSLMASAGGGWGLTWLASAAGAEGELASADPSWTDIASSMASAVTAIGVVIAGAFAYLRYARGRVSHARCEASLSAELVDLEPSSGLLVHTRMTNAGTLQLEFSQDCLASLTITSAGAALWEDAANRGEPLWSAGVHREQDLFTVEGVRESPETLEPGEALQRATLIPLPPGRWIAHRLQLDLEARPRVWLRTRDPISWRTEAIFVPGKE